METVELNRSLGDVDPLKGSGLLLKASTTRVGSRRAKVKDVKDEGQRNSMQGLK